MIIAREGMSVSAPGEFMLVLVLVESGAFLVKKLWSVRELWIYNTSSVSDLFGVAALPTRGLT